MKRQILKQQRVIVKDLIKMACHTIFRFPEMFKVKNSTLTRNKPEQMSIFISDLEQSAASCVIMDM